MMTLHATQRCQQRAIPRFAVELYLSYGSASWHNGAEVYAMDKAAHRRIEKAFGGKRALRAVEPLLDGYIVVAEGKVITVAHRQCRLKRDVSRKRG